MTEAAFVDGDRLAAVAAVEACIPRISGCDQMGASAHRAGRIGHGAGGSSIRAGERAWAGGKAAAAVRGPGYSPSRREGAGTAYHGGNTGNARTIINDRGSRATAHTRRGTDDRNCVGHRDLHVVDVGNSIVGAVGGKRHAEAAVIDLISRPGGAPQIIVGAISGSGWRHGRPFCRSGGFIAADQRTALHQADYAVADIVATGLTAFVAPDRHLDAVDGGIARKGKAIVGAFQVMRGCTKKGDLGIIGVVRSDDCQG